MFTFLTHPVFLVGLGSATGGILRYYFGRAVDRWTGGGFPWGTFVINAVGSFLLGILALWVLERLPPCHRWAYLLLGTGFCGGFTTFSTFSYEAFKLLRDGSWVSAGGYVIGSVLSGIAGVVLAAVIVRAISRT